MSVLPLLCHPAGSAPYVREFTIEVERREPEILTLKYRLHGELARLRLPDQIGPVRADGLWNHTCFEVFLRKSRAQAYLEGNFSPSGAWALYRFDDYRRGMTLISPLRAPQPSWLLDPELLEADVELDLAALDKVTGGRIAQSEVQVGIAAVLEADDGTKSYWALSHPAETADFHHAQGLMLTLPMRPGELR